MDNNIFWTSSSTCGGLQKKKKLARGSPNPGWSLCCGLNVSVLWLLHAAHLPSLLPEITYFFPKYFKFHAIDTARVVSWCKQELEHKEGLTAGIPENSSEASM